MNGCTHKETPCLERLLELMPNLNLKWDRYIRCWKNRRFPVPLQYVSGSSKYVLALQESDQVENDVILPYHGISAAQFSRSNLDIQKRLRGFVSNELFSTLQPLSHVRYVEGPFLLYRYCVHE